MKRLPWLMAILLLFATGGFAAAPLQADNNTDSTFTEVDNNCGGSSRGMSMGGCGIPSGPMMSGGCGIPSGPSMAGPGQIVPRAPAFEGSPVVPVPEPSNTAHSAMNQLAATIGKPGLEDPTNMSEPVNKGIYAPVTTLQPVTEYRTVTQLQPVQTWRPVTTMQPVPVAPPTSGYQYVERRLGLLGLRGKVISYQQYGGPMNYSAELDNADADTGEEPKQE